MRTIMIKTLQEKMPKIAKGDLRKDVFALSFSPDGKKLASGGRDTAVEVWDVVGVLKGRQQ